MSGWYTIAPIELSELEKDYFAYLFEFDDDLCITNLFYETHEELKSELAQKGKKRSSGING